MPFLGGLSARDIDEIGGGCVKKRKGVFISERNFVKTVMSVFERCPVST